MCVCVGGGYYISWDTLDVQHEIFHTQLLLSCFLGGGGMGGGGVEKEG